MFTFILVAAAGLAQAADDPFVGTWRMNPAQSRWVGTTAPLEMIVEMQRVAEGVHYRSASKDAHGLLSSVEYTANYDAIPTWVSGSTGVMMPVMLKQIDDHTVDASYLRGLSIAAVARRVVSNAGARMTITTSATGPGGLHVVSTVVYDRIEEKTVDPTVPARALMKTSAQH